MIMCVLCYPVSFHMLQLLLTGRPISSYLKVFGPESTVNTLRQYDDISGLIATLLGHPCE